MGAYEETLNLYVLTIVAGSEITNSDVLVYNFEFGTWTIWKDINARSISQGLINNRKVILIGKENGAIGFFDKSSITDYGSGFSMRFRTATLYPGDLTSMKTFKSITVFSSCTRASTLNISWDVDGSQSQSQVIDLSAGEDFLGTTFILGTSRLGVGQYLPRTISIDQHGYGIQIEMSITGASEVEIYGFILEVEDDQQIFS